MLKKVHLICNAHIDPVWQWDWEEGASAAISTFQSAVNLAEKYDYIFCHNEVTVYRYAERFAPELFENIRALVKKGKWHIMGGWYLQPDCLLPEGEGIIRQIQAGKLYFEEKFGVPQPKTVINFDAFGHSRGLVQIIKKCGQEGYLFMRPWSEYIKKQLDLPAECFLWEGYDGSRIKAARITDYCTEMGKAREKIERDIEFQKDSSVGFACWGLGNHGGGPSAKDLRDIALMQAEGKTEIVHSTPDAYFKEVEPDKVYASSLIPCMVGCYTSMIRLKQKYRELERQLFFTEKIASMAALSGVCAYPTEKFREAAEDMMDVQFHDMLPGTSIASGEESGLAEIYHGLCVLNRVRADAFFALCRGQKVAKPDTYPVFVFNPKPFGGKQLVECELSIAATESFGEEYSQLELFDESGSALPCQTVKESSNQSVDRRKKAIFEAELTPLAVTRLTAKAVIRPVRKYESGKDIVFDDGRKRVVIGAKSGLIERFSIDGAEFAEGDLFAPFSYEDTPDPWGMRQMVVGENPVPFTLLEKPDGAFSGMKSLQIIEDGEIYLGAEAFFGCGPNRMRIGYKIYKNQDFIDIDVNLFPGEADRVFKLCLPIAAQRVLGEQIFGEEELFTDGRECVSHNYLAWERGEKYIELVTPHTYGSSHLNGKSYITLARTATYCAHPVGERPLLREGIFIPKIDMGQRDFAFRLQPAKRGELKSNADLFTERPYALNVFPTGEGSLPQFGAFLDNRKISLVTIKKSEQLEGYIVRLFNGQESADSARLTFGDVSEKFDFGKFEVKTIFFDGNRLLECDRMYI